MSRWVSKRGAGVVLLRAGMCLVLWMLPARATVQGGDHSVTGSGSLLRDSSPPDAITDLVATRSALDVILTWSIPADDVGVTSFRVYQYNAVTGAGAQIAHILSGLAQTYTVRGVCGNSAINFFYDVRAEDAAGNIAGQSNLAGEFDFGAGQLTAPMIVATPAGLEVLIHQGGIRSDTLFVSNAGGSMLTITSVQSDAPWLTGLFPTALPINLNPGASSPLAANVNAGALTAGDYEGVLSISSNDPDDPILAVEVDLSVLLVEMVPAPGGSFWMGADNSWAYADEQPVHAVTVRAFWIGKYETTNEQMRAVMQWAYDNGKITVYESGVYNAEGDTQEFFDFDGFCQVDFSDGVFTVYPGREDWPVVDLSWYGAQAFCNYLSDIQGLDRCISFDDWSCDWSANGYRLPTEAEWEWACRAWTTTDYYNGDETQGGGAIPDPNLVLIAWYYYNAGSQLHDVGGKDPNQWGLFDMSGNAWELCWDWYDYYDGEPQLDPTGPEAPANTANAKVLRGGMFYSIARGCRSAVRSWVGIHQFKDEGSFRPVRR